MAATLQKRLRRWFAGTLPVAWEDAHAYLRLLLKRLEDSFLMVLEEAENSVSSLGRDGGQTVPGGKLSGSLTLTSTTNSTKTKIYFGAAQTSAYDELTQRLGLGNTSPAFALDVVGAGDDGVSGGARLQNTNASGAGAQAHLELVADVARVVFNAAGSGRTATRFGITVATWSEFIVTAGAGLAIGTSNSAPLVFGTNNLERLRVDGAGNVSLGTAALATTATDGFLYIPSCAGAPTGVPTAKTGRVPVVYDSTNNRLYVYNAAWKSVILA